MTYRDPKRFSKIDIQTFGKNKTYENLKDPSYLKFRHKEENQYPNQKKRADILEIRRG